jgi:hypothetical protein
MGPRFALPLSTPRLKRTGKDNMNRKLTACLAVMALALVAGDLGAQDPNYVLTISGGSVGTGGSITLTTTLDSSTGAAVQGWSYGVCHDQTALELTAIADGATTLTVKNGSPPDFNEKALLPAGYTVGVVICFTGCATLAPGVAELSTATYSNLNPGAGTTDVCPCSTLGNPAVSTVVVVGGGSIPPVENCGTVESVEIINASYIRGDANDDQLLNIADGVWMLNELFQNGPANLCPAAADANSDGGFDASDAVYVFNHQFLNGPPPAAPFPACGPDGVTTTADCLSGCP